MATATEPVDAKAYYGYLYDEKKTPTPVLSALLRAIGQHIIDEIGDKNDRALSPTKLAAFYRALGGNYDSLFLNAPQESISYIWQVTGCQHRLLQPADDDFAAPIIPALTLKGFVRWESIQILLVPEEHVPFILLAVNSWNLRNPDTGEPFPVDIPKEAFPSEPDEDINAWHVACGERLRKEATPKDSPRATFAPNPADRMKGAFSHVPAPGAANSTRPRAGMGSDYFSSRPVSFAHVNVGPGPGAVPGRPYYARNAASRASPERPRVRRTGSSSAEDRARRRSFSDIPPSPDESPTLHPSHLGLNRPIPPRRHSHPRPYSSSDGSEEDLDPHERRRNSHHSSRPNEPPLGPKFRHFVPGVPPTPSGVPPTAPNAPPAFPNSSVRVDGAKLRLKDDDRDLPAGRRKSYPIPFEWARDKLSSVVPGLDRPRNNSRNNSNSNGGAPLRSSAEKLPPSRFSRSYSHDNDDSEGDDSSAERDRRRRAKRVRDKEREREEQEREHRNRDRDRDRDRERERDGRFDRDRDRRRVREDRDWDFDRDRPRSRKERDPKFWRRPDNTRRTSSHADIDRQRSYEFDGRDRERDRERLRDERRRFDDSSPVVTGVSGRKYPTEPAFH